MQWKKIDERLERSPKRRCGKRGITPKTQVSRIKRIAEPQAEVIVARYSGAFLEQSAVGTQAQLKRRRAGHFGRNTGIAENAIDIAALDIDDAGLALPVTIPVAADARTEGSASLPIELPAPIVRDSLMPTPIVS